MLIYVKEKWNILLWYLYSPALVTNGFLNSILNYSSLIFFLFFHWNDREAVARATRNCFFLLHFHAPQLHDYIWVCFFSFLFSFFSHQWKIIITLFFVVWSIWNVEFDYILRIPTKWHRFLSSGIFRMIFFLQNFVFFFLRIFLFAIKIEFLSENDINTSHIKHYYRFYFGSVLRTKFYYFYSPQRRRCSTVIFWNSLFEIRYRRYQCNVTTYHDRACRYKSIWNYFKNITFFQIEMYRKVSIVM